ncbi:MAG: SDR family NAD(P)-dependent oxidoreductase [Acidobacteriota bacterium]
MNLFDLKGQGAVVTGGNSGIGLGYARGLISAGAKVCIWGTNEEKNEAAREELASLGGEAFALRCDVSDEEAVKGAFARSVELLGRVDSCFANAGIGSRGTAFAAMTAEEWRQIFAVNMEGVFFTFRESVQQMMRQGDGGSLVVTSSLSAVEGAPRAEHYAATKAGVVAMIRALAVEHARHGIRANAVLPGWIETAMTERVMSNDVFTDKVQKRIPMRRWGTGDDFAGIAVYLASAASSYHTADTFLIDGGYAAF